MPELPEVETVMCGLKPHLEGAVVEDVIIRHSQLRWPIPLNLKNCLQQQTILYLARRGKYLLITFASGTLIIHLGMSGSLRIVSSATVVRRHDHVDVVFSDHQILRYHDPRRFGAILWTDDPNKFSLLSSLGVEPLEANFTAAYLKLEAEGRRVAVKSFIMNSHVVVGIGNIYAAEALHFAKIHPLTPSGLMTLNQWERLKDAIQQVLQSAIYQGGTTLKDFVNSEGNPGYFAQKLHVYGRAGKPCLYCKKTLESLVIGQRSTVFCSNCQLLI